MGNEKSNETYVCNDCGDTLRIVPTEWIKRKEVITLASIGKGRFLTEIKRVPSYNS